MESQPLPGRRRFLLGLAAPLALGLCPPLADAAQPGTLAPARRFRPAPLLLPPERGLTLHHLHTGETLRAVYYAEGRYQPESLRAFNWLLRDWRAGRARTVDPELLDLVWALRQRLECGQAPIQVVCGYRTPATNAMLRRTSEGVARNSLHLRGMAIDLRVPGRSPAQVRAAAASLKRGGVGYYPASGFVHVDTGRVRSW